MSVKMKLNLKVLTILLIFLHSCNAYHEDCSDSEMSTQCSTYCYGVVKPLLEYVKKLQPDEKKLKKQEIIIQDLKESVIRLETIVDSHRDAINMKNNELKLYQRINATQSELLITYKNQIDKLIDENTKTNEILTTTKKDDMQLNAIKYKYSMTKNQNVNSNLSSCLTQKSGTQQMIIHEIRSFPVPCDSDLAGTGWTVIQRRKDSLNFDRNWEEYRMGFGELDGSFFIGLEKLYLLTNERPHELYIYLKSFENESRFARYDHFQIGDEKESFKIKSVGNYSGTAGDSLTQHINMKFSTSDHDNDTSAFNCASEWGSGWWFKNCAFSNLNGRFRDDEHNLLHSGIKWNSWEGKIRFTFVQMMIRPLV